VPENKGCLQLAAYSESIYEAYGTGRALILAASYQSVDQSIGIVLVEELLQIYIEF